MKQQTKVTAIENMMKENPKKLQQQLIYQSAIDFQSAYTLSQHGPETTLDILQLGSPGNKGKGIFNTKM